MTITQMLEEIEDTFCREYCKYYEQSLEEIDKDGLEACNKCPCSRI